MKRWGWLCCLFACQKPAPVEPPPHTSETPRLAVQVEAASPGMAAQEFTTHAEVQSLELVHVVSLGTGRINHVRFAPGTRVAAGALLVELDHHDQDNARAQAAAEVARCKATLAASTDKLERRRAARSANPALVLAEDWQVVQSDMLAQVAACDKAALIEQAAALQVAHAAIRAPRAGVMQSRDVAVGQFVQPGTLVGTLAHDDPRRLAFHVPLHVASRIAPGDTVSYDGGTAVVTFVACCAQPESRQVEVHAVTSVNATVRPGSTVTVHVQVPAVDDGVHVPRTAIVPSEDGLSVFVEQDGTAQRRVVVVAPEGGDTAHVRSGLAAGERVVTRGTEALYDGAPVHVDHAS